MERTELARPLAGAVDDTFSRVVWWLACLSLGVMLAAGALLAGVVFYGVATWRRWSWKGLVTAGLVGLAAVLVLSGPGPALERHLAALRELVVVDESTLQLIASRWGDWLSGQLPLGIPLGALLAAWPRWKAASVTAHQLSAGDRSLSAPLVRGMSRASEPDRRRPARLTPPRRRVAGRPAPSRVAGSRRNAGPSR
jgi:hypothetical protein